MKAKIFFTSLFITLFSVFSFAAQSPADMAQAQKNDGQNLETVIVIDNYEVDAAKMALKNSSNPVVKKFAQIMISNHSKNAKDAKALANKLKLMTLASDKSNNLQQDGKKELDKLQTLSNKDFDKEYIDAMVSGHQDALNLLDKELIPNTTNPKAINFLQSTRKVVAHHLEMAKQAQKQLNA